MSLMMDNEGDISRLRFSYHINQDSTYELQDNEFGYAFFRKYYQSANGDIERQIVAMIHNANNSTLLRIFAFNDYYYDAELLEMKDVPDQSALQENIHDNLQALHELTIVYVDIHNMNVGYSRLDQRWKLLDFDSSGILKTNEDWLVQAPILFNHRRAYQLNPRLTDLRDIDWVLYKNYFRLD